VPPNQVRLALPVPPVLLAHKAHKVHPAPPGRLVRQVKLLSVLSMSARTRVSAAIRPSARSS